jgi:inosine-uridine nucleoside N-ribohydrolase
LAAALIFKPKICKYAEGKVEVEVKSDKLVGATVFNSKSEERPHRISTEVNAKMFFEEYFGVTSGK